MKSDDGRLEVVRATVTSGLWRAFAVNKVLRLSRYGMLSCSDSEQDQMKSEDCPCHTSDVEQRNRYGSLHLPYFHSYMPSRTKTVLALPATRNTDAQTCVSKLSWPTRSLEDDIATSARLSGAGCALSLNLRHLPNLTAPLHRKRCLVYPVRRLHQLESRTHC